MTRPLANDGRGGKLAFQVAFEEPFFIVLPDGRSVDITIVRRLEHDGFRVAVGAPRDVDIYRDKRTLDAWHGLRKKEPRRKG